MTTIQTSFTGLLIFSVLPFLTGCLFQQPCSERVLVEIPITTEYRDPMHVGDTIHFMAVIPKQVMDMESGIIFTMPDNVSRSIEILIEDIDGQEISDRPFSKIDIFPVQGNINVSTLSTTGLQVGQLEFEQNNDEDKVVELSIIPRHSGRYAFTLFSFYAIFYLGDDRFFTKEIELFGSDDCSEELNLVFTRDGGSDRGYTDYTSINDTTARVSLEFYRQSGTFFITVVE